MSKKVECGSSAQYVRRPFTRLQQCAIAQGLSHPSKSSKSPRQGRIFPLTGEPYFTHIFSCSDLLNNKIVIPKGFYNHLRDILITAIFSCEGKTWEVMYFGDRVSKYFGSGLNNFIFDNDIREGDGVVFELIHKKNLHFRVQILHVDVHFHAKDGDDGGSTDNPILID
ncbi:B3 domain-containing protein Os04g0386900-like [Zingiber officinale]|uniref:B3 domain-containing protein Os04g0386900-like n=1 Tax=Zingiber officinale TaxID=94328 RepID=UPI001C4DB983|nr:B3 domain-containing protein Os04g0386900-like [Zingiber officinale]XP_042385994.1 B3 domain-containing protein Os04g0386900-like [Zingiber officinale]